MVESPEQSTGPDTPENRAEFPENAGSLAAREQELAQETLPRVEAKLNTIADNKLARFARGFAEGVLLCQALSSEMITDRIQAQEPVQTETGWEQAQAERGDRAASRMKERIKQFQQQLEVYKTLGFEPELVKTVGTSPWGAEKYGMSTALDEAIVRNDEAVKSGILGMSPRDPLGDLDYYYGDLRDIPPELRQSNKINIYPYSAEWDPAEPNQGRLRIYDWLNPEKPVAYEAKTQHEFMEEPLTEPNADAAAKFLSEQYKDLSGKQAVIDRLPTHPEVAKNWKSAWSVEKGISASPEEKEAQRKFFDAFASGEILINGLPWNASADRPTSETSGLRLTKEIREANDFAPWQFAGQLQNISLSREIPQVTVDDEKGLVNGLPADQKSIDRFGNLITHTFFPVPGASGGYSARESFDISPPIVFGSSEGGKDWSPTPIDLSPYGLPEVSLVNRQVERPIAPGIYTNMEARQTKEKYGADFKSLRQGASQAENLLGLNPGHKIKNIYLVNSEQPNAYFADKDPETIIITDEMLKDKKGLKETACHESLHLLDKRYDLSGGRFERRFNSLKSRPDQSFFRQISEGQFLPDSVGGHAWDSRGEFLSSFVNSLVNHPDWEKALAEKDPAFRQEYRDTAVDLADDLRQAMRSNPEISGSAPLYRILKEKIALLDQMNSANQAPSPR